MRLFHRATPDSLCGAPELDGFKMKPTACIETSVVSYLCARPSRDVVVAACQRVTRDGWRIASDRFDLVASALVVAEAGAGDAQAADKPLTSPLPQSPSCRFGHAPSTLVSIFPGKDVSAFRTVVDWPSHILVALGCLVLIVFLMAYIAVMVRRLERIGRLMVTLMGPWTRNKPRVRDKVVSL